MKAREAELLAAERVDERLAGESGGMNDPSRAYMQGLQMDALAKRREELRHIESLEGDELVMHYCAGEIAQNEMPFAWGDS